MTGRMKKKKKTNINKKTREVAKKNILAEQCTACA
jgi:ribosomal protein L4